MTYFLDEKKRMIYNGATHKIAQHQIHACCYL